MKQILVFGYGGPAAVLLDYLRELSAQEGWMLNIMSDIESPVAARREHIAHADVVISLAPGYLQRTIAEECIELGRHLISPAPLNPRIMNLRQRIEAANILCLYEMGFDPGLDHMSALQFTRDIQQQGGKIISLHTHSGRLPAPENDDNPWHCKISDARVLIDAAKQGAVFREKGQSVQLGYHEVFNGSRLVEIPGLSVSATNTSPSSGMNDPDSAGSGFVAWYPVKDSMGYMPLYGLKDAETFIRTNLCHPDFMYGWKNVIDLNLVNEFVEYDTDGMTLAEFFKLHFERHGFSGWLEQKMMERYSQTKQILDKLMQFMEVEQASELSREFADGLMIVDEKGKLESISIDSIRDNAAAMVAYKMHEANLTLKQLFFLGMDDKETYINKGRCTAADVLQFAMEKKLAFGKEDNDMVVMMHELEYEAGGKKFSATRRLTVKGRGREAAADIVTALILGIAARLVLAGEINLRGLHLPVKPSIYAPVLEGLGRYGVRFE